MLSNLQRSFNYISEPLDIFLSFSLEIFLYLCMQKQSKCCDLSPANSSIFG